MEVVAGLILGLASGIAGIIWPLFGPVGASLPNAAGTWAEGTVGGARAVAKSGFDSIGGVGPFGAGTAKTSGAGVLD